MEEFYLHSITYDSEFNLNSDITLYVYYGGAAFRICYAIKKLASAPSLLEQHYEAYRILHIDNPEDGRSRETSERLRRPFEELMARLAANRPAESTQYLHDYLYPPWYILEAVANGNRIQPHLKEALMRQEFVRPGEYVRWLEPYLSTLIASNLHAYSSRQIQVLVHTSHLIPSKVLQNGTTLFFKPWVSGPMFGYHELESHRKILEANPPLVLQHYRVNDDEENHSGTRLVGLLLSYIDSRGTMRDLAPWADCTNEDRLRWSEQINESLKCLHAAGVVWGDAKPENVLVDKEGNAFLIDFGGSYTQGWVDEDKQETVEGDLQGVRRIQDWLAKWLEKPLARVTRDGLAVSAK
ncbi:hypothetical protein F4778DRAFT_769908 [Xylariomycetidae sp. FL2044]|nr:hypothetical protein F4778DRAFT_769908 [Xylariomycetidae sp. FL2044]